MMPIHTYYTITRGASGMTPAMLIGALVIGIVLFFVLAAIADWILSR
jgi:hypothetical protein